MVPPFADRFHRELFVLADGDEPALRDEGVDLGLRELALLDVHPDGVARQEGVGGVAVDLGALVRPEGVLDGQLVEAELVRQFVQLVQRGPAEVDPDHGVRPFEVIRDIGDREPLGFENTLAVRVWAMARLCPSEARGHGHRRGGPCDQPAAGRRATRRRS